MALTWENKQEIWSLFFKGDSKESIASQVTRRRKGEEGLPVDKRVVNKVANEWLDLPQEKVAFLREELKEIKNAEVRHFTELQISMKQLKNDLLTMLPEKYFEEVAKRNAEQDQATLARWYPKEVLEHLNEMIEKDNARLQFASESDNLFGCLPYHLREKEFWVSFYKLSKGGIEYMNALSELFESTRNKVEDATNWKVLDDSEWFISMLSKEVRNSERIHSMLSRIAGGMLTPYFVETICCYATRPELTPLPQYKTERIASVEALLLNEEVMAVGDSEILRRLGDMHAKMASELRNCEDKRIEELKRIIGEAQRLILNMLKVLDEALKKATLPNSCPRCPFSIKRLRGEPNPKELVTWLNA